MNHILAQGRSIKYYLLLILAGLILGVWLAKTPAGLLGKADAIAYAVCHRIPDRSFFLGDRPLPLCARCTGMYLGALAGLLYQFRLGRRGGMPSLKIGLVLGAFFLAFAVDGINSYLHLFPSAPGLYEPKNYLRLLTGSGLGVAIAAMLYPTFNQVVWANWSAERTLSSWRQLIGLLGLVLVIDLAVLTQNPLILYPLALVSSATVWVILGTVYTIVWVLILHRENTFTSSRQLGWLLLAGFVVALAQIALMDVGRFAMTGTWAGFFAR